MAVFHCALISIFICCVRDKAEYQGKYMSDTLRDAFGFPKKGASEEGSAATGGKDGAKGQDGAYENKSTPSPSPKKKGKNTVTQVL